MNLNTLLHRLMGKWIDFKYQIETCRFHSHEILGLDPQCSNSYAPINWLDLQQIFSHYQISDQDIFLDLGCGKGRALFCAYKFPFKKIIGVEISPLLFNIAQKNLKKFKHSQNRIKILHCDAQFFMIPDDVTFIFLFNPFKKNVFLKVIDNIKESINRSPRTLRLIYCAPEHADLLSLEKDFKEDQTLPHDLITFFRIFIISKKQ